LQTAARAVSASEDVTLLAMFKLISRIAVPVISRPGPQSAMVGVPFRMPLRITSECQATVTVSGLPAGLTFDAVTRTIGGVPSAVPEGGAAAVRVSASNIGGKAADALFTITVAPLAASAQGTFSGIALVAGEEADTVKGLFTMTVAAAGKISAKVTAQDGAYSFAGASWGSESNGVFRVKLRTVKGETLVAALDTGAVWDSVGLKGTLIGGALGATELEVQGQRNAFLVKTAPDYAAATNALDSYKGYYTVALPPDTLSETGAAGNAPKGCGYLTLTVKEGGVVTLAGKLADGAKLGSASTLLILNPETESEGAYVPLFFPLYSVRGAFAGLLHLGPAASASPVDNAAVPATGFVQAWNYPGKAPAASPSKTEDGFAMTLGMVGGFYSPLADLRAHYSNTWFTAREPGVSNTYSSGAYTAAVGVVLAALPEVALTFDPKTGAVSLPAGKVPAFNTASGAYAYAPTNPAVATLAANRATGLFAGKFNIYYEYRDQTGALKLKKSSVSHEGVLTPVRVDLEEPSGWGFYLVPDTWKSPDARPVAYPLKRSYRVDIW